MLNNASGLTVLYKWFTELLLISTNTVDWNHIEKELVEYYYMPKLCHQFLVLGKKNAINIWCNDSICYYNFFLAAIVFRSIGVMVIPIVLF